MSRADSPLLLLLPFSVFFHNRPHPFSCSFLPPLPLGSLFLFKSTKPSFVRADESTVYPSALSRVCTFSLFQYSHIAVSHRGVPLLIGFIECAALSEFHGVLGGGGEPRHHRSLRSRVEGHCGGIAARNTGTG